MHSPAKNNLGGRDTILVSDSLDSGIREERRVGSADGGIGGQMDALLFAVFEQTVLRVARMQLNLGL